jgi:hypothetical protein
VSRGVWKYMVFHRSFPPLKHISDLCGLEVRFDTFWLVCEAYEPCNLVSLMFACWLFVFMCDIWL